MKKSDVMVADIIIYALNQIQMARTDQELTGEIEYWNGEIMAMKYLLLYIDKLVGEKKENDVKLPDLKELFNRVNEKRRERFELLSEKVWEEDLEG